MKEYMEVSHEISESSIFGYIVDTKLVNMENWLAKKSYSEDIHKQLTSQYQRVMIFVEMYVEEDERNEGVGTELLDYLIEEAESNGAEIILLEADTSIDNEFDLVKWYESKDFVIVENERDNFPLMMKII